jgi:TfoX/Sxy family transcriptional regulator of competence genes
MASTKDYRDFILEQLRNINVTDRYMMSEYILYYNGIIFGGIYDDRLLVKKTETNKKYNMEEVIPYPNAKPMYYVTDVDNEDTLIQIVLDTYEGLK